MKVLSYPRSLSLLCLLATFTLLSGCAANLVVPDTVITTPTGTGTGDIQGNVYGGRQPIQGAHIYLYGAANTGYGAAGISLLGNTTGSTVCTAPLTADSSGNCYYTTSFAAGSNPGGEFNLTGLYKCNVTASGQGQPGQQVWLYSIGGSPGVVNTDGSSGNTVVNPAAAETAALGTCPTSNNFSTAGNGALSYIYVNEVSTVAFAYAVAGFAGTATNAAQYVGAPSNHYSPNLTNAFANAAQMYDIAGGADPGDHGARHLTPGGNGVPPFLLINTVADAMSVCINSNNVSGTPSATCQSYFQAIYNSNSYPTTVDTASAAVYLAKHPGATTAANVFSVASNESPWLPNYSTSGGGSGPSDATAAINFPNINGAYGIVLDATGNAYVTEYGNIGHLVKLPSAGASTMSSTTLSYGSGITIDSNQNLWIPGQGSAGGVLHEFRQNLTEVSGSPYSYTPALTNAALQIAADASGSVYLADYQNNEVVKVSNATPTMSVDLGDSKSCTDSVKGIAYNASTNLPGTLWVTGNSSTNQICNITPTATTGFPMGGKANVNYKSGVAGQYVAVDSSGSVWSTAGNSNIYNITTTGTEATVSSSSNLVSAGPVAIDGANNIWVINNPTANNSSSNYNSGYAPSVAEYCSSCGRGQFLSPSTSTVSGFQYGSLSTPAAIAIDGSGDVWITNNGLSEVTELIGAAAPVTTPLSGGTGSPNAEPSHDDE